MKKAIAILLIMGLVLGSMTSAAFAKKSTDTLKYAEKPDYSTYEFKYDLPQILLADRDVKVDVTFQTKVEGRQGYNKVNFKIESECILTEDGDNDGQVTFAAKDSEGKNLIIINGGIWGPQGGFQLPAKYQAATNWTLNFSKAGKYNISFALIDQNGKIVANTEKKVTVKVVDGLFLFNMPQEVVEDETVDWEVSLETEQSFDNAAKLEMKIEGPAKVDLKEIGTNNWNLTNAGGYWNADIDDSYNKITKWQAVFPQNGKYTIRLRLISEEGKVLVEDSLDIDVKDDSAKGDDKDDEEDDDRNGKGKTHGLLNALYKHLAKGKINGGTLILLELLKSRGIDLEEAIEAIEKDIEKGLAGTCRDYEILGKLYKEKNREREVFINGKRAKFDVPPIVQDGRTLLPFRQIAEALGAEVKWDGNERKVIVKKENKTVELFVNKKYAKVNGEKVELDVPARIHKNRTVIPIRFLAEALDANVDYYPEGSIIVIVNKK